MRPSMFSRMRATASRRRPTAGGGGGSFFGFNGPVTGGFPSNNGRVLVTRWTLPVNATLVSLELTIFNTATNPGPAKGVILAVSAGEPTTVLYVTGSQTAPAGGAVLTFSLSGSLSAGDYYLGGIVDTFNNNVGQGDVGSFETRMANGTFNFTTPPGTWPGTDASYSVPIAAKVNYTPA